MSDPGRASGEAALASLLRLHIVAIGAMGTWAFGRVFTGEVVPLAVACSALDWFLLNVLNRVGDLPEDERNGVAAARLARRHARTILVVAGGTLVASFVATAFVAPWLLAARLAFQGLGFLYNWPVLPRGGRRVRLKQLYAAKNAASATGFLLTVLVYPLARTGRLVLPPAALALTAAFFFVFELSYEVIYDLRDAPGDREEDVRTFAAVHGEDAAARLATWLASGSIVLLEGAFLAGQVPLRLAIMGVAPVVQIVWVKVVRRTREVNGVDCVRLTWLGAGLLATFEAWCALGLPGATS